MGEQGCVQFSLSCVGRHASRLLHRNTRRFPYDLPQQLISLSVLHQQAADEFGGDDLGGAGEEGVGEMRGGLDGYGRGLGGRSEIEY